MEKKTIKCKEDCPVRKLITHNTCVRCENFKDSPYYRELFNQAKEGE